MKRFGSRSKGKNGEREVGRLLERWWRELEPGCHFVSTPLSGGFSTREVRAGMKLSGDLCTTATRFSFVVEVKRREKWNYERLLRGLKSPVWGWWEQCKVAAVEMGGKPLLLFRKNREPWYFMMKVSDMPIELQRVHVVDHDEKIGIGLFDDLLAIEPKYFACAL